MYIKMTKYVDIALSDLVLFFFVDVHVSTQSLQTTHHVVVALEHKETTVAAASRVKLWHPRSKWHWKCQQRFTNLIVFFSGTR